jgi:hypothetical protein
MLPNQSAAAMKLALGEIEQIPEDYTERPEVNPIQAILAQRSGYRDIGRSKLLKGFNLL